MKKIQLVIVVVIVVSAVLALLGQVKYVTEGFMYVSYYSSFVFALVILAFTCINVYSCIENKKKVEAVAFFLMYLVLMFLCAVNVFSLFRVLFY